MSSGGSPSTTTTTNSGPPSWAVPYFQQGIHLASTVANKPYTPYTGQLVAGQNADQLAGMAAIRQQAGNTALSDAGSGYAQGLLGGAGAYQSQANPFEGATTNIGTNAYAGSNPYLDKMIASASKDVTDAYTKSTLPNMLSQFNSGGAFGGTAMADALATSQEKLAGQLGDLSNQFRFQDYTTQQGLAENALNRSVQAQQADFQRNASLADARLGRDQQAWDSQASRQMQALGLIPNLQQAGYMGGQQLMGIGQQQQLNDQAGLDANYDQYLDARDWDQNRLNALTGALGTITGGSSSTTGQNPNYRSAGQNALTAAAIVASFFV